jgi:bile acid:Na+ symporter, BASS family
MNLLTAILLPALVFLVMGIVGTGLTVEDLRRVLVYPRAVITGTLAQIVLLPLLAVVFVRLTEPAEIIAAGLLLLVTCPGGAVSNSYTYLARANLGLSVTLTAFTSILSVLTMPVAMRLAFEHGLGRAVHLAVPTSTIALQLAGVLLTPVAIGMLVRWKAPALVERSRPLLQAVTWIAILAIAAFVLWTEREHLRAAVGVMILFACGFTVVAMALGVLVSRLSGSTSPSDHFVLMVEFAIRNLPIATLVGTTALGRTDFVVFSGAVLFAQTPMLVALVLWFRKRGEG